MSVFRFKIKADEQPDFFREVEIGSDSTFHDFHLFIVKILKLSGKELASFYISNDAWEKLSEITLLDMSGDVDEDIHDEDTIQTIFVMDQVTLEKFLSQPGQRLIYEYDFLQLYTFLITLEVILKPRKGITYPRVTASKSNLLIEDNIKVEKDPEKLKAELLKEFNEIVNGDDDDMAAGSDDF